MLDLHGLYVNEALDVLHLRLCSLLAQTRACSDKQDAEAARLRRNIASEAEAPASYTLECVTGAAPVPMWVERER